MKKKILLRAPCFSSSGYGLQSRYALKALLNNSDKFDVYVDNIPWGRTGWIPLSHPDRGVIDELLQKTHQFAQQGGQFDVSLQVTIPNEFQRIAPVNIGYTAGIETNKIAPQWIEKSAQMDRLIVISNHAKHGFDNTEYVFKHPQTGQDVKIKNQVPVTAVNYYFREIEKEELSLELETSFNFLTVVQWSTRKNLETTLNAFLEEFKDEEDVGLVLKISLAKNNVADRMACKTRLEQVLASHPDRKCKVYLLHGELSDREMYGLYSHEKIKAMVSTTHGEGFGFPLFEAAGNGLPLAAPGWSGQVDFLYVPVKDKKSGKTKNKPFFTKIDFDINRVQQDAVWEGVIQPDSAWCFAKFNSTKRAMREIFSKYDEKLSLAKKLQKYIKTHFTEERFYKEFVDAMDLGFEEQFSEEEIKDWLSKMNVTEHE